jgi:EAL domain-containing protein (putative c-di-GMP-specific phosphodiesterase class I)
VRQAIALIARRAKVGRSLTLDVNLSAKSIGRHFVAIIDRAVADARIDPARLVFELTETAEMCATRRSTGSTLAVAAAV